MPLIVAPSAGATVTTAVNGAEAVPDVAAGEVPGIDVEAEGVVGVGVGVVAGVDGAPAVEVGEGDGESVGVVEESVEPLPAPVVDEPPDVGWLGDAGVSEEPPPQAMRDEQMIAVTTFKTVWGIYHTCER